MVVVVGLGLVPGNVIFSFLIFSFGSVPSLFLLLILIVGPVDGDFDGALIFNLGSGGASCGCDGVDPLEEGTFSLSLIAIVMCLGK